MIDFDYLYFFATRELRMSDEVFWDSGLSFLFGQLDKYKEMNEKINKKQKRKNGVERTERVEKKSFKKLSQQEIAELRARANN